MSTSKNVACFKRNFITREIDKSLPSGWDGSGVGHKFLGSTSDIKKALDATTRALNGGLCSFRQLRNYQLKLYWKLVLDASGILPMANDAANVVIALGFLSFFVSGETGSRVIDTLCSKQAYIDDDGSKKLIGHLSPFTLGSTKDDAAVVKEIASLCGAINDRCEEDGKLIDEKFIGDCTALVDFCLETFTLKKTKGSEGSGGHLLTDLAFVIIKLVHAATLLREMVKSKPDGSNVLLNNVLLQTEELEEEYLDFSNYLEKAKEFVNTDYDTTLSDEILAYDVDVSKDKIVEMKKKDKRGNVMSFWSLSPSCLVNLFEEDVKFFNEKINANALKKELFESRWNESIGALKELYAANQLGLCTLSESETLIANIAFNTVHVASLKTTAPEAIDVEFQIGSDIEDTFKTYRTLYGTFWDAAASAISSRYHRVTYEDEFVDSGLEFTITDTNNTDDIIRVDRLNPLKSEVYLGAFRKVGSNYSSFSRVKVSTVPGVIGTSGEKKVLATTSGAVPTPNEGIENISAIDDVTKCLFVGDFSSIRERAMRISTLIDVTQDEDIRRYYQSIGPEFTYSFYTILPPSNGYKGKSFRGPSGTRLGSGTRAYDLQNIDPSTCSLPELLLGYLYHDVKDAVSLDNYVESRFKSLASPAKPEENYINGQLKKMTVQYSPLSNMSAHSGFHFLSNLAHSIRIPTGVYADAVTAAKKALPAGKVVPSKYDITYEKVEPLYLIQSTLKTLDATTGKKIKKGVYKKDDLGVLSKSGSDVVFTGVIPTKSEAGMIVYSSGKDIKDNADGKRIVAASYPGLGLTITESSPLAVLVRDFEVCEPRDVYMSEALENAAGSTILATWWKYAKNVCMSLYWSLKHASVGSIKISADSGELDLIDNSICVKVLNHFSNYLSSFLSRDVPLAILGVAIERNVGQLIDAIKALEKGATEENVKTIFAILEPTECAIFEQVQLVAPFIVTEQSEFTSTGSFKIDEYLEGKKFIYRPSFVAGVNVAKRSGFFNDEAAEQIDLFITRVLNQRLTEDVC